jgi:hypothetical protein
LDILARRANDKLFHIWYNRSIHLKKIQDDQVQVLNHILFVKHTFEILTFDPEYLAPRLSLDLKNFIKSFHAITLKDNSVLTKLAPFVCNAHTLN